MMGVESGAEWVVGSMSLMAMAAVVITVILAGLVHGALGLGFPMVATPLIAVFLDVRVAILITLLPTAAVNIASIWTAKPTAALLRRYSVLAVTSLVGAVIGAMVLAVSSAEPFKLLLALLILLFLYVSNRGISQRGKNKQGASSEGAGSDSASSEGAGSDSAWGRDCFMSNPLPAMIITGLLGGFSAGTTNVMVAILIIYFLALEVERREMVPAMNLCFLIGKVSQIAVFAAAGLVDLRLILTTTPLALIALAALWAGQKVSDKIPQDRYRRLLRYLLAVLAAVLLYQFFSAFYF
jgi:uncharacterized membrane protein YfcA